MIVYKRTIRPRQIQQLYALARLGKPCKLASVPNVRIHDYPDFQRLKYWGLIEEDQELKHCWKVTRFGLNFLCGYVEVPKCLWIYKNEVIGGPEYDLREAVYVHDIESKEISKEIIMREAKNFKEFIDEKEGVLQKDLFY